MDSVNEKAIITVDLGNGDGGKGSIVHALTGELEPSLVVRYNGGPNAGHNVIDDDGDHHTFSQFGSGTLLGAATLLSRFCLLNPLNLEAEAAKLLETFGTDYMPTLYVDERIVIITPYQQALNRIREMFRAEDNHSSCGEGLGETVHYGIQHPNENITVADIVKNEFVEKLKAIRTNLIREYQTLEWPNGFDHPLLIKELAALGMDPIKLATDYVGIIRKVNVMTDAMIKTQFESTKNVIFEGSQGVLLHENFGPHPYTTWSDTSSRNAKRFLDEVDWKGKIEEVGIMRAYGHRHGKGPFPTENAELTALLPEEYSTFDQWQGSFRVGWLDLAAIKYALKVNGKPDYLAVTCIDRLKALEKWQICTQYFNVELEVPYTLEDQEKLTEKMFRARPMYQEHKTDEVVNAIEYELQLPAKILSTGPLAEDKEFADELVSA